MNTDTIITTSAIIRINLENGLPIWRATTQAVEEVCPQADLDGNHPAQAALLAAIFGEAGTDTAQAIKLHSAIAEKARSLVNLPLDAAGYLAGHPDSPVTKLGL